MAREAALADVEDDLEGQDTLGADLEEQLSELEDHI